MITLDERSDTIPASGDDQPLVSCIIIFLDEEPFRREAIECVLAQTYANWELLLIDDGSTDRSGAIAREVAAGDHRVRYLTHDGGANLGMSASRNLGLRHARGSLVAFLDGDDTWLPDKLARQVAIFEENPDCVMVCGATLYWRSWDGDASKPDQLVGTGDIPRPGGGFASGLEQDRLYGPGALMKKLYPLGRGSTPSASGYMITHRLAAKVGGFENDFRGVFEDQVFRAKAYLAGSIYVSSSCFDRYRQHSRSSVHVARATGELAPARRAFLRWLAGYLDSVDCRDRDIRRKLRRTIIRHDYPLVDRILRAFARKVHS
jgi:glycosyltransferase involved in cell wall biosynthesis